MRSKASTGTQLGEREEGLGARVRGKPTSIPPHCEAPYTPQPNMSGIRGAGENGASRGPSPPRGTQKLHIGLCNTVPSQGSNQVSWMGQQQSHFGRPRLPACLGQSSFLAHLLSETKRAPEAELGVPLLPL